MTYVCANVCCELECDVNSGTGLRHFQHGSMDFHIDSHLRNVAPKVSALPSYSLGTVLLKG